MAVVRRVLCVLLVLLVPLLAACGRMVGPDKLPPGVTLVEESSGDGELGLPYSKYRLANGLTLILHPDDSDPLVHVDVTYHVGSAREQAGQSGFAHFFEHMMFQGSANVADEEHFRIISEAGGDMNGTTNSDRTNYYQTVPANYLETVLWLESDRMGYLLPAMTEEKFRIQQETVLNERGQRVDNAPYGRVSETIDAAMYPAGHPYSWPTIGWREDIQNYRLADLAAFFKRWYGPNNAVLTIGGAIDVGTTLAAVAKYFGPIAAGPAVEPPLKSLVKLDENRFVTLEDRIHLPMLVMSFPTVYARHADEAPLDLLASMLGDGKSSLLYRNLVASGKAVGVNVYHPCRELGCAFTITATLNPDGPASLAQLYDAVRRSLKDAVAAGVSEAELEKLQNGIKAGMVHQLETVAGKVSLLASGEIFGGQPDQISADLQRYQAVTAADVERVYSSYLANKAAVVVSVVPPGQGFTAVAPDNFYMVQLAPLAPLDDLLADEAKAAPLLPPLGKHGPLRPRPAVAAGVQIEEPQFWRAKLNNGIAVLGITQDESPGINLLLSLEGGILAEPPGKDGVATLTALMLEESTLRHSAEEMDLAIARMGSQIDVRVAGRYTEFSLFALEEHIDDSLRLLRERLFEPAFKADEFARVKERYRQQLLHQQQIPAVRAEQEAQAVLYGDQRVGRPQGGTPESIARITLADVQDYYRRAYSAGVASFSVVSPLSASHWQSVLAQFGGWKKKQVELFVPDKNRFPTNLSGSVRIVNLPGSPQTAIRVVRRAMPFAVDGDYFAAQLVNYPLGGAFNSRLNLKLREEHGYTYGASSRFVGGKDTGQFVVATDVRDDVSVEAAKVILQQLAQFQQQGMSDEELAHMRQAVLQSEVLNYETPQAKARFLAEVQRYGLKAGYTRQQAQLVSALGREQLNDLARRWLSPRDMTVILVGDGDRIRAELRGSGDPFASLVTQP